MEGAKRSKAKMTTEQVDKLIAFGKMALEQGWYDQAREHFEQALNLDASNREAMKGLARVNEILSYRAAVKSIQVKPVKAPRKPERRQAVKPVQVKPVEAPRKPERRRAEPGDSLVEWFKELPGAGKIVVIIMGFLIMLTCCTIMMPVDKERAGSTVKSGGDGRLYIAGQAVVPVAIDKSTYLEMMGAGESGFYAIVASSRVLKVPNNTKVSVLSRGLLDTKVIVVEGTYYGQTGWVPSEWVK